MENPSTIDYFLIKTSIYKGCPIATSHYHQPVREQHDASLKQSGILGVTAKHVRPPRVAGEQQPQFRSPTSRMLCQDDGVDIPLPG